mgnify:CR=1 FL=1
MTNENNMKYFGIDEINKKFNKKQKRDIAYMIWHPEPDKFIRVSIPISMKNEVK